MSQRVMRVCWSCPSSMLHKRLFTTLFTSPFPSFSFSSSARTRPTTIANTRGSFLTKPTTTLRLASTISNSNSNSNDKMASSTNSNSNASRNQPPKHQMVHYAGLLADERRFGVFRKVLHTGLYSQLVAMEIPVGGDIGDEVHTVDQILLFTRGTARATVAGKDQDVKATDVVVVPAGTQHQFVNTGDIPLELITVYSPAEHDPQTVHKTKEEGDKEEDEGRDEAPEWSQRSKKGNEEKGLVKESGGSYEGE